MNVALGHSGILTQISRLTTDKLSISDICLSKKRIFSVLLLCGCHDTKETLLELHKRARMR